MGISGLLRSTNGTTPIDFVGTIFGGGHPFVAQLKDSFWLPVQGSATAGEVDVVFYTVYAISAIFFALIVGLMIAFAWRYRHRAGHRVEPSPHHSLKLEVAWTVVPVILSGMIFWMGFKTYMNLATPPANAYEINVTGQKWQWFFTYPNGYVASELHVPVDRPVRLTMTSEDVIHSLWVPAFRIKKDVVPGRYTREWFQAKEPGTYRILCTEYCGTGHSDMLSEVVVHEPGGFEKWLREASDLLGTLPPAEAGQKLYKMKGCAQCHSIDGSPGVAPTFKDFFGGEVPLQGGETITADENYVRESIVDPLAKIHRGFEPVMPTFAGKIKDQEITMLIAFMKSISVHAAAESAPSAAAEVSTTPADERDPALPAEPAPAADGGKEGE